MGTQPHGMPRRPFSACGEEAAPSPLLLQGLLASLRLWPRPLQMPRSGLKQVWVLPTAIAQLWEPLAVNSDSATSVTDLPSPQRSSDEGKQGNTAPPCPVLLVGCRGDGERGRGSSAGSRRGRWRPCPLPKLGRVRVLPSCCLGHALLSRLGHPWAVGRPPASSPGSDLIERMSARGFAGLGNPTAHVCKAVGLCAPEGNGSPRDAALLQSWRSPGRCCGLFLKCFCFYLALRQSWWR